MPLLLCLHVFLFCLPNDVSGKSILVFVIICGECVGHLHALLSVPISVLWWCRQTESRFDVSVLFRCRMRVWFMLCCLMCSCKTVLTFVLSTLSWLFVSCGMCSCSHCWIIISSHSCTYVKAPNMISLKGSKRAPHLIHFIRKGVARFACDTLYFSIFVKKYNT